MSPASGTEVFTFAGFSLSPRQRLLFGPDGAVVPLSGRAFDTLLYLVEHPDELIDKQALMKAIWPHAIVEENNLNQNISIVRRALGETAGEHRFVVTVPGRGFRFVPAVTRALAAPDRAGSEAPVEAANAPPDVTVAASLPPTSSGVRPPQRAWSYIAVACAVAALVAGGYVVLRLNVRHLFASVPAASASRGPSIAVLPFVNMSPEKDQEYFSDGLTEELSAQLGQLQGLTVVGRSSAFAFKGKNEDLRVIGTALGVDHILEGTVRRAGNELRITAELVDARSGARLWSQIYDRKFDDIFTIQKEIGSAVATELRGTLGARDPALAGTNSVAAYDAYLAGLAAARRDDYPRSIAEQERAVALDPMFVRAWSALANAYDEAPGDRTVSAAEYRDKGRAALLHALSLAPESSELIYQSAVSSLWQARDWTTGERWARAKLDRSGGSDYDANRSLGLIMLTVGRPHAAVPYLIAAKRAEPFLLSPAILLTESHVLSSAWREVDAEADRSKVLPGDPNISRAFFDAELFAEALEQRDRARIAWFFDTHRTPSDPLRRLFRPGLDRSGALAEIRQSSEQLSNVYDLYALAQLAAYFDDPELALGILRKVSPFGTTPFLIWRPGLKEVRRLPGFKDLVRDLRLVDYWRATGDWSEFCHPVGNQDFACS